MHDVTSDSLFGGKVFLAQPAKGHRAGTDAVLLAAASGIRAGDRVLDIGASTGAVGLMAVALQPQAHVVFVERDPDLAELCRLNCERNRVPGMVAVADILDKTSRANAGLLPESADLVLTNPPFLEEGQARVSPHEGKAAAHALPAGGLEAWLKACLNLLKPKGRLVLIHRADRLADCLGFLGKGVGGIGLRFVHPSAGQPAVRMLLSATKGSRAPLTVHAPVILNGPDGEFTPWAAALHRGEVTLT